MIASLLLALMVPFVTSALTTDEIKAKIDSLLQQITQLQEQIKLLTQQQATSTQPVSVSTPSWCIAYKGLTFGARGTQVFALQQAMGSELGSTPTGYYGVLTKALWARRCNPETPPAVCTAMAVVCPAGSHAGGTCNQQCIPDQITYSTITISSFSGPSVLTVGQQGTWSVSASDSHNRQLSYKVVWGDEQLRDAYSQILEYAAQSITQQTTFTHVYAQAGTYTVVITVSNTAGEVARATATVRVEGGATVCTQEYAPVCGLRSWSCDASQGASCNAPSREALLTTYGNLCALNAAGATYVRNGACPTTPMCWAPSRETMVDAHQEVPFGEGERTTTILSSLGQQTITDAYYACRNGQWKIEGGYPTANTTANTTCNTGYGGTVPNGWTGTACQMGKMTECAVGAVVLPLYRCANGTLLTCDWQGNNCH